MRRIKLKGYFVGFLPLAVAFGAANSVNAQNNRDYREWQQAQRRAQKERQDYLRTRSSRDYREWQRAQREARRERMDYRQDVREDRRDANRRFRYTYNGRNFYTDQRGAALLRQAVNNGYQRGYRQGQLDRRYGRRNNYYGSTTYRSSLYGYQSYVDRNQYQYYFQQGFQKGYEDGFYTRTRYGYRSGNAFNVLGSVLNAILNLADN
jgi:hypothetical protein